MVFFTQGMTTLTVLILMAYCFDFAEKAGINQGCLICITTISIFWVSLLFYLKFNDRISPIKLIGTFMMIPCIVFVSLGKGNEETEDGSLISEYTDSEKQYFSLLSVFLALVISIIWTITSYFTRQAEGHFNFPLFDLAIDSHFYSNVVASLMYLGFIY